MTELNDQHASRRLDEETAPGPGDLVGPGAHRAGQIAVIMVVDGDGRVTDTVHAFSRAPGRIRE